MFGCCECTVMQRRREGRELVALAVTEGSLLRFEYQGRRVVRTTEHVARTASGGPQCCARPVQTEWGWRLDGQRLAEWVAGRSRAEAVRFRGDSVPPGVVVRSMASRASTSA